MVASNCVNISALSISFRRCRRNKNKNWRAKPTVYFALPDSRGTNKNIPDRRSLTYSQCPIAISKRNDKKQNRFANKARSVPFDQHGKNHGTTVVVEIAPKQGIEGLPTLHDTIVHAFINPFCSDLCPRPNHVVLSLPVSMKAPTQPRDWPSSGTNSGGASAQGLCDERSRRPFQAKQASISTTPGKMSRTDRVYPFSAAGVAPAPAFANTAGQVPQGRSASMPPPFNASVTAVLPIFGAGLTVRPASTDAWASSAAPATVSCTSVAVQPISSVMGVNSAAPSAPFTGFAVEPASAIAYASSATPAAIAMDAQPASTAPRQGRPKGNSKGKACFTTKKTSASAVPATGRGLLGATIDSALPSASRCGRPPKALEFGIKVSESREVSQKFKKKSQVSIAPVPVSHTSLTPSAISTFRSFGHQRASPTSSKAPTPPNATGAPNAHGTTASTIGPALSDLRIARPHAPPIVDAPPKPSPWSPATVEAWRRFGMADNEEEEPSRGVLGPLGANRVPEEISNSPPPVRASDGPLDLRWVFPDAFGGEGSGRFGVPTFEEQQARFDELFFPDPACDADASWIPSSMTDPCAAEEKLSNPDDDMEWLSAFDNDEWLKG